MVVDIILSKEKVGEFIKKAEELDYDSLIFANLKNLGELQEKTKIKLYSSKDITIKKADNNVRNVMQKNSAQVIYSFEEDTGHDGVHYRNSGMNQVICKIASENNVSIGFSFSQILNSNNKKLLVGRMEQNIRLCRKYNLGLIVGSFANSPNEMRNPEDLKSLFVNIGMTAKEAKDSLIIAEEIINKKLLNKHGYNTSNTKIKKG